MPVTPEQVVVGYAAAVRSVRARVVAYAGLVWASRSSYRDADIDAIVGLLVPRVQAGQLQVANLTAAYIAQVASLRRGVAVSAVPVDRELVVSGRGEAPEVVYRRPAVEVYTALSEGVGFRDAAARGGHRLSSLVATDMQMAKVRQSQASFTGSGAKAYRRVLNGPDNCRLCRIAATQRYRTADLLPIHPGCDCGVDEIEDGPQVIDQAALERVYDETEDPGGWDLVMVREHGEFGPTLTWRDQHFDGPRAVA